VRQLLHPQLTGKEQHMTKSANRPSRRVSKNGKRNVRQRLAASGLVDAAELVVARWEQGDLAEAVRKLSAAIAKAKGGIS
jgi:hypothetical protein